MLVGSQTWLYLLICFFFVKIYNMVVSVQYFVSYRKMGKFGKFTQFTYMFTFLLIFQESTYYFYKPSFCHVLLKIGFQVFLFFVIYLIGFKDLICI
jgi:hypothetical protein